MKPKTETALKAAAEFYGVSVEYLTEQILIGKLSALKIEETTT